MIRCQACGNENPPGTTYCLKCATRLDAATQENVAQRRREHAATGTRWTAVIAALIALLLIIALVILFATHVI